MGESQAVKPRGSRPLLVPVLERKAKQDSVSLKQDVFVPAERPPAQSPLSTEEAQERIRNWVNVTLRRRVLWHYRQYHRAHGNSTETQSFSVSFSVRSYDGRIRLVTDASAASSSPLQTAISEQIETLRLVFDYHATGMALIIADLNFDLSPARQTIDVSFRSGSIPRRDYSRPVTNGGVTPSEDAAPVATRRYRPRPRRTPAEQRGAPEEPGEEFPWALIGAVAIGLLSYFGVGLYAMRSPRDRAANDEWGDRDVVEALIRGEAEIGERVVGIEGKDGFIEFSVEEPVLPRIHLTGWEELPDQSIDHAVIERALSRRGLRGIYESGRLREMTTLSELHDYLGTRTAGRVIDSLQSRYPGTPITELGAEAVIAESILHLAERHEGSPIVRHNVVYQTIRRGLRNRGAASSAPTETVGERRRARARERLEEQRRRVERDIARRR